MERTKPIFINGIKTKYLITDRGSVYSTDFKHTGKVKRLKTRYDKDGYEIVTIYLDGKRYDLKVHRLVAIAFIPNPKNKPEVNHKNGNKKKNNKKNLEWATTGENIYHAFDNGLTVIDQNGEKNGSAKHTNKIIEKVCKSLESNKYTIKEISEKYGVPRYTIEQILAGNQWTIISDKYDLTKFTNVRKYTDDTVIKKICKLLASGKYTVREVADKLNVKYKLVYRSYKGESHKNISSKYDFTKVKK